VTQEEFVNKWRNELLGFLLDFAIADLKGGLLYARLKMAEQKMTTDLNLMYRDANAKETTSVTLKPLPPKGESTTQGTSRPQAGTRPAA